MARIINSFESVDRFVTGTVGEPGERAFYIQARFSGMLVTVAIEKTQAQALVERLQILLKEIRKNKEIQITEDSNIARDDQPLDPPIAEDFRAGVMAITWLNAEAKIMIEAQAISQELTFSDSGSEAEEGDPKLIPDDDLAGPDLLRVKVSISQVKEFIRRTTAVIDAGRTPCTFCSIPIDPGGHLCPRANGYRR